jgi:UDP-2,3-diacylglucosamine pyrophosphatase LpxH
MITTQEPMKSAWEKLIETSKKVTPDQFNDYINLLTQIATLFTETHHYKWVFWGHTHYAEIRGKLVNCGDFCSSGSYVVLENGNPTLVKM